MRYLIKEGGGVDSDKFNFSLGSSETQVDVFTNFEDAKVAAQIDSTHIDGVFFDFIQQSNQDQTVGHNVEQVVTFGCHREAILDVLIVFEVFVPKSSNHIAFFD